MIDATIAGLERQLPLQGLDVVDHAFGLHRQSPVLAPDHGIPRPQVPGIGQRNLRGPMKAWVETRTKAPQEPHVGSVAKGVAGGICSQSEVESENLAHGRQVLESQVSLTALEPPKPRMIHARRCGHIAQAQSRTEPGTADVRGHAIHAFACPSPATIGWSFSCSHWRRSWRPSLNRHFARRTGVLSVSPQGAAEPNGSAREPADRVCPVSSTQQAMADLIICRARWRSHHPLWSRGQRRRAGREGHVGGRGRSLHPGHGGQPAETARRGWRRQRSHSAEEAA